MITTSIINKNLACITEVISVDFDAAKILRDFNVEYDAIRMTFSEIAHRYKLDDCVQLPGRKSTKQLTKLLYIILKTNIFFLFMKIENFLIFFKKRKYIIFFTWEYFILYTNHGIRYIVWYSANEQA